MSTTEMMHLFSGAMLRGFGALAMPPRIEVPRTSFANDAKALWGDWEIIVHDCPQPYQVIADKDGATRN